MTCIIYIYYIYIYVCLFCTSSLLLDFLAASCVFRCLLDSYLVSETISGDDRSKQAQNGSQQRHVDVAILKRDRNGFVTIWGITLKWQWAMAKLINHVFLGERSRSKHYVLR